eukprot:1880900-Pyramimonas_sp.AAC.1
MPCGHVRLDGPSQATLGEARARVQRADLAHDLRAVAAIEAQMCEQQAELVRRQRKQMVPE